MSASIVSGPTKVRIFLVDDHPIVCRGLQLLLSLESDLEVCGQAGDSAEALQQLPPLHPDLAIVDISLKHTSGLQLVQQLRACYPQLKILVFSMHAESFYAEWAMRAGAHGYLTKNDGVENVIEAIRFMMQGKTYLNKQTDSKITDPLIESGQCPTAMLSQRELQVLQLLGRGLSVRRIAGKLRLSIRSIESHREHIRKKLSLRHAAELTNYAYNWVRHYGAC